MAKYAGTSEGAINERAHPGNERIPPHLIGFRAAFPYFHRSQPSIMIVDHLKIMDFMTIPTIPMGLSDTLPPLVVNSESDFHV
jgi:hypothetical protein